jgi:hypothetical protein
MSLLLASVSIADQRLREALRDLFGLVLALDPLQL